MEMMKSTTSIASRMVLILTELLLLLFLLKLKIRKSTMASSPSLSIIYIRGRFLFSSPGFVFDLDDFVKRVFDDAFGAEFRKFGDEVTHDNFLNHDLNGNPLVVGEFGNGG